MNEKAETIGALIRENDDLKLTIEKQNEEIRDLETFECEAITEGLRIERM